jgi:hypothetical protein
MLASYARQWRQYRLRHWAASLWLVLGLPAAFALAFVLLHIAGVPETAAILFAILCWAAAWWLLCIRVTRFPCPRCSSPFLAGQEPIFKLTRHCSNCGLKLYGSEP